MILSSSGFSVEALTLAHEDPTEHRRLYNDWMAAYPYGDPIEQAYIDQAVAALIEKRRAARVRATLRGDRVRTAVLFFDRDQEDYVAKCLELFSLNCSQALKELTRTAAGCRWAIAYWKTLDHMLITYLTWYGEYRIGAIQLQGFSANIDMLCYSEPAFRTWLDCLVCNPNPKQKDIDRILDPMCIPKALADRDVVLWPGDPAESRARLRAIVAGELSRLGVLEEMLRVQYEEPARAEAQDMALASLAKEEMPLLRAERMYEQSHERSATALMKARKQAAASRRAAAQQVDESTLRTHLMLPLPAAPDPAPDAVGSADGESLGAPLPEWNYRDGRGYRRRGIGGRNRPCPTPDGTGLELEIVNEAVVSQVPRRTRGNDEI